MGDRHKQKLGDTCKYGHVLTEESASVTPSGYLQCRKCRRMRVERERQETAAIRAEAKTKYG